MPGPQNVPNFSEQFLLLTFCDNSNFQTFYFLKFDPPKYIRNNLTATIQHMSSVAFAIYRIGIEKQFSNFYLFRL